MKFRNGLELIPCNETISIRDALAGKFLPSKNP